MQLFSYTLAHIFYEDHAYVVESQSSSLLHFYFLRGENVKIYRLTEHIRNRRVFYDAYRAKSSCLVSAMVRQEVEGVYLWVNYQAVFVYVSL